MKSKKTILVVVAIIVVLLGCGIGYYIYQDKSKQADINEKINEISESEKTFSTVKDRNDKFDILKSTFEKMEEYNSSPTKYDRISEKYVETISNMQTEFKEEYNNTIKENTIDNLDSSEDIEALNMKTENLNALSTTIESEKKYTLPSDSDYQEYTKKISSLTKAYSNQINNIEQKKKAEEEAEAQKKAEEEAQKKAEEAEAQKRVEEETQRIAEEKAKTHYENEYFSVDVPQHWIDCWSVTETTHSSDGTIYAFSYDGDNMTSETSSGGGMLYVVDVTYGLPQNGKILNAECELVGYTSNNFGVFMGVEAGAGFFTHGATITLK